MSKKYFCISFTSLFLIIYAFVSCNDNQHKNYTSKLIQLDSAAYKYPRFVLSRIDSFNNDDLNDYDKHYKELIKIIAEDKMGCKFESDTTINKITDYFSRQSKHLPQNYMRSLMYQGVIRFQRGISDNKAYEPIKEALKLSDDADETQALNLRDRQIAFYYLGLIQNKNNNISQSHDYFKQALFIAEILNDSIVLFKTYRDMYWNRMKALDFFTAKSLLQTLQSFRSDSEEQLRDMKNAEATFYNGERRYRNALELDYELLKEDNQKNDKEALLADYYRISDNYKYLNRLDSALHYGELAAKSIIDTSFYLNYYYYLNVAEIAAQMGDFKRVARLILKCIL
ncbi:MAG: hypothetical protein QM751_15320 [Paludibacteraceae bacterium]